jgi:hypothetical protein
MCGSKLSNIYDNTALVRLFGNSFTRNSGRTFGNSIYISGEYSALLESRSLHSNNANSMAFGFGGAVCVEHSLIYSSLSSKYEFNENGFGGAISVVNARNIFMRGIECTDNKASSYGGCLYLRNSAVDVNEGIIYCVHMF